MPEEKILTVDFAQKDAFLEILPRSPLLSSYHTSWDGVRLDYHQQPAHATPEHSFKQHIIAISLDANPNKAERVLDGQFQIENIKKGDVMIIPADVHQISRWESEAEFIVFGIEPAFLTRTAIETRDFQNVELVPHFATPDPLIYQLGLALKSQLEADGTSSLMYIQSLVNTLCVHLLKHYCASSQTIHEYNCKGLSRAKLRQAISYIQNNLEKELSLIEIADELGMSMYHFSRMFKQSIGSAPHQYVMNCRIEKAKKLLLKSENTIEQIGQKVGFHNQSHFTNVFRKLIGTTPKVYREQVRI